MIPEKEHLFFQEAFDRKHKLETELQLKKEYLRVFKRRELHATDEERDAARDAEKDIVRLEQELREAEEDMQKFTPTGF